MVRNVIYVNYRKAGALFHARRASTRPTPMCTTTPRPPSTCCARRRGSSAQTPSCASWGSKARWVWRAATRARCGNCSSAPWCRAHRAVGVAARVKVEHPSRYARACPQSCLRSHLLLNSAHGNMAAVHRLLYFVAWGSRPAARTRPP